MEVVNSKGFLSCNWKDMPPPRVGQLTDHGRNGSATTCRYFPHQTFIAPQYTNADDVLDAVNLVPPKTWPDLVGTWTSIGNDGTYSDSTIEITKDISHPGGFKMKCTDAGEDNSCDPVAPHRDTQHTRGGWHAGTITLKPASADGPPSVSVSFDSPGTEQGFADRNLTAMTWGDTTKWIRKNREQHSLCCALCNKQPRCRGWTLDENICSMVKSIGQHYPSATSVSGYPTVSEAATYCNHMNDNTAVPGQAIATWGDARMSKDVACASFP